jgi:hypothetical protein
MLPVKIRAMKMVPLEITAGIEFSARILSLGTLFLSVIPRGT